MKQLYITILLLACYTGYAQSTDLPQQYETLEEFRKAHRYNKARYNQNNNPIPVELGISAGPSYIDEIALSTRLQANILFPSSIQLCPMLNVYTDGEDMVGGPGLGLNFIFSSETSYYYLGMQASYLFGPGLSAGVHFGYTTLLSKVISFNIEPEIIVARNGRNNVSFVPSLYIGLRFNL